VLQTFHPTQVATHLINDKYSERTFERTIGSNEHLSDPPAGGERKHHEQVVGKHRGNE
jgi:hypothetical protein